MIDWLEVCRDIAADVDAVLADLPTRAEREPVLRLGEGGDETTAIDQAAEDAVVARLRALELPLTVISEEIGELELGGPGGPRVVVDPIDGSLNAKRGIPFFSLSVAVADGPTMGDVAFGYVFDYGAREEWTAERGGGAFVDGVCSLKPARSVDIAAAQLLVRECGLAIELFEDPPFEGALLDLVGRSRVVAAGTPELCAGLAAALR